jgi:hypothetical protein
MRYAIGEILLVVVGILIALSINNWNEARKEKKELHEYLAKIKSNIEADIVILDSLKTRRLDINSKSKKAFQGFVKNHFDLAINLSASEAFIDFYFVPNQSGYDALKNSSYLGKINGTKVDSLLDNYNNILNKIIEEEVSYNSFLHDMEVRFLTDQDLTDLSILYFNGFDELKKNPKSFKKINEQAKIIFNHNAYKAIIMRSAVQTELLAKYYSALMYEGEKTITEINTILND